MTSKIVLYNHHFLFACEAINGLNRFYNIPVEVSQCFGEDFYFNDDIRWAIVTISYLFRRDFFKIFSILRNGLKNKKQFKEYCMLIPVKRNDRYFFNFLRRVSLIYEMAVYCYKKGDDHFLKARNCIAQYEDKEYFFSAGSWLGLNKTACILRELGKPFLLVILEESTLSRPLSFSATVDRIESRLKLQNDTVILNSDEMSFLIEQKEKFIARERDAETKNIDSQIEREKVFTKSPEPPLCVSSTDSTDEVSIVSERQAIMDYLGSFLDPKVFDELQKESLSLESTKYERSTVSKSLKPFQSEKLWTDTESTVCEEYHHLTTNSASSLCKKLAVDMQFLSNPNLDEQWKVTEGTNGSGDKCRIYQSSPSSSCFPSPSSESNKEERETWNLSQLEEDLYLSDISSVEENSQQRTGENATITGNCPLSVKCGLYSSNESIISESQSSKKQVFSSDNKTSDLKQLEENLYLSECSFKDEYARQSSTKNEPLENDHTSPVKYGPGSRTESNTLESQSPKKCIKPSEFKDSDLKPLEEDLYIPSSVFNVSHFYASENVALQQSKAKKGKRKENDPAVLKYVFNSSPESSVTADERSSAFKTILEVIDTGLRFKIRSTMSAVASALNVVNSFGEESQDTTSNSPKPVSEEEGKLCDKESESDSDTTVRDSPFSSKPRQHSKGKGRRKKKGKSK